MYWRRNRHAAWTVTAIFQTPYPTKTILAISLQRREAIFQAYDKKIKSLALVVVVIWPNVVSEDIVIIGSVKVACIFGAKPLQEPTVT